MAKNKNKRRKKKRRQPAGAVLPGFSNSKFSLDKLFDIEKILKKMMNTKNLNEETKLKIKYKDKEIEGFYFEEIFSKLIDEGKTTEAIKDIDILDMKINKDLIFIEIEFSYKDENDNKNLEGEYDEEEKNTL